MSRERLLTSSNGNLPFARAARTFCGEKGSIRSEARLASRSSQHLSSASAGGDVPGAVASFSLDPFAPPSMGSSGVGLPRPWVELLDVVARVPGLSNEPVALVLDDQGLHFRREVER